MRSSPGRPQGSPLRGVYHVWGWLRLISLASGSTDESKKLIFHPEQSPDTAGMYRQNLLSWFKRPFRGQVVQSIKHFTGINRVDQNARFGNKLFHKGDQFIRCLSIAAEMVFGVPVEFHWPG